MFIRAKPDDAETEFDSEPAGIIPGQTDFGESFNNDRDHVNSVFTLKGDVLTANDGFTDSTPGEADKFDIAYSCYSISGHKHKML